MLQEKVAVLNLHRRADVNLHAQNALQRSVLFIEIDCLDRRMVIDPVLMMTDLFFRCGSAAFVMRK